MDEAIKIICHALKEEAEAVISNTEKIEHLLNVETTGTTISTLEISRLNAVEHIQSLTIELTKLMSFGHNAVETDSEEDA